MYDENYHLIQINIQVTNEMMRKRLLSFFEKVMKNLGTDFLAYDFATRTNISH